MAAGDLITSDGQIEWRQFVFGANPQFGLRSLTGWLDLPPQRLGVDPRAGRHGAYAGQFLSNERTVTATLLLRGLLPTFQANVRSLRRITASNENGDEEPLVIQMNGIRRMVFARCARRDIPVDNNYSAGVSIATLQWVASDPRQYILPQLNVSVGLAASSGGLVFPLVFPLDFGLGTSGGLLYLTNSGNAQAWPIFNLQGPLTAPQIINITTGKVLAFKSTTVIPAGQTWQIDTNYRTVTLLGSASSNRNGELQQRQWFAIDPGATYGIQLTSGVYDPAAQLSAFLYSTDL